MIQPPVNELLLVSTSCHYLLEQGWFWSFWPLVVSVLGFLVLVVLGFYWFSFVLSTVDCLLQPLRAVQTLVEMFALSWMQDLENSLWYFLILGLSNSIKLLFDKISHIIFQHFICLLKVVIDGFVELTSFFRFFFKYRCPQIFVFIKIDPERLPKFSPYVLLSRQRWYLYWLSPRQSPYIIFTDKMEMSLLQFFVVVNSQIGSHLKSQIIQINSTIVL